MFFQSLNSLLQNVSAITVTMTPATDGDITITVIPTAKKDAEKALATPIQLTGSPEELDAEFAALISRTATTRKSLAEQLDATEAVLEAARKDASSNATKAVKKVNTAVKEKAAPASLISEEENEDESLTSQPVAKTADIDSANIFSF